MYNIYIELNINLELKSKENRNIFESEFKFE